MLPKPASPFWHRLPPLLPHSAPQECCLHCKANKARRFFLITHRTAPFIIGTVSFNTYFPTNPKRSADQALASPQSRE